MARLRIFAATWYDKERGSRTTSLVARTQPRVRVSLTDDESLILFRSILRLGFYILFTNIQIILVFVPNISIRCLPLVVQYFHSRPFSCSSRPPSSPLPPNQTPILFSPLRSPGIPIAVPLSPAALLPPATVRNFPTDSPFFAIEWSRETCTREQSALSTPSPVL